MSANYLLKEFQEDMPKPLYMQMMWLIRNYSWMKKERLDILYGSAAPDGQPRASGTSDATASKAVRLAVLDGQLEAIDQAVVEFNARYEARMLRDDIGEFDTLNAFDDYGLFCYLLYHPDKESQPSYRTWKYFRTDFAKKVAQNLKLIY